MSDSDAITKVCTSCRRELPATGTFFYNHPRGKWGLAAECKDCRRARTHSYYLTHREAVLIRVHTWQQDHRAQMRETNQRWQKDHAARSRSLARNYKARKAGNGGAHTAEDIEAQYKRQKGRCYYCKTKVGSAYHVDHVVPTIKGGSNSPENLVIACPECNLRKHGKHPMDWCGRLF